MNFIEQGGGGGKCFFFFAFFLHFGLFPQKIAGWLQFFFFFFASLGFFLAEMLAFYDFKRKTWNGAEGAVKKIWTILNDLFLSRTLFFPCNSYLFSCCHWRFLIFKTKMGFQKRCPALCIGSELPAVYLAGHPCCRARRRRRRHTTGRLSLNVTLSFCRDLCRYTKHIFFIFAKLFWKGQPLEAGLE